MRFYDEVKERWQKSSWISLAAEFCQENTHRCLGLDVTHIGPFFCCNSNHISEKLEKRWRNRMIRAAARNALVRALRLNECLEDVEALYAEPKPWCFIKLYGTEKEGKYWYSFANTPEGAKERTQFMRK